MTLSELRDWLEVQIERHERMLETSKDAHAIKDSMAKLVAYKRTLVRSKGGE
jgi:hypothetical protein